MKAFVGILLLVAVSMAQMDKRTIYGELAPLFARYAKNFRTPSTFTTDRETFSPETIAAIYRLLQQNNFDFRFTPETTTTPFNNNFWWNKNFNFNPTTFEPTTTTPTWFERMAIERFFKKFIFDNDYFNTNTRFMPTKPFVTEVKTDVVVEAPRDFETETPFSPFTTEFKYKPTFGDFKRMRDIEREMIGGKPTFDTTIPFWFKKFFGKKEDFSFPTTTTNFFDFPTTKLNGKRLSMVRPSELKEEELKTLITLFLEKAKLNDKFQDINKFKTIYTPKDVDFEMLKNLPLFESLDKMKYTYTNDKKFEDNLEKVKEILNKEKVDFSDLMKVAPFLEKIYTKMTPLEKMEKMEKMVKTFPTEEVVY